MKLLVDSCAWSLMLRRRAGTSLSEDQQFVLSSLEEAIQDGQVILIGPIRQEILSGIKVPEQFDKLRAALGAFEDEPLSIIHFEEAARLFNLCRSRGVECGSTDILICAVAIQRQCGILTYDRGLKRCVEVLREAGIMS